MNHKAMSLLLAGVLAIPNMAVAENPVSDAAVSPMIVEEAGMQGSELSEKQLEKIITEVKRRFPISDAEAEFHYSAGREYGQRYYTLNWESDAMRKSVKIGADNNIYAYSYYAKAQEDLQERIIIPSTTVRLPKHTPAEARRIAETFFQKCFPAGDQDFVWGEPQFYGGQYTINATYQKNGIAVDGIYTQISIDDQQGYVADYHTSYNPNIKFEDARKVIGIQRAQEIYRKEIGLKKIYTYDYNYEKQMIEQLRMIYVPKKGEEYAIAALSGKVEYLYDMRAYGAASKEAMTDAATEEASLTPKERAEVVKKAGLKSMEQAKQAAIATGLMPKSTKLTASQLYDSYDGKNHIWSLQFMAGDESYRFSFDAKTLEMQYYSGNERYDRVKTITAQQVKTAKAAADQFLGAHAKRVQGKLQYEEPHERIIGQKSNSIYMHYVRAENDAEVLYDGVTIAYDLRQGKIVYYSLNWTELDLPKPKQIASESSVLDTLLKESPLKLGYRLFWDERKQNYDARLYYDTDRSKPLEFDVETGARIQSVEQEDGRIAYSDLQDSKYQAEIKTLIDLGIGYSGGKLLPKQSVTYKEFLSLLAQTKRYGVAPLEDKEMEALLRQIGLLKQGESLAQGAITNEAAASYLIRAAGYEALAAHDQIFTSTLPDLAQASKEHRAAVIIADAIGLREGKAGAAYAPKRALSREGALKLIYNYLKLQS